MEHTKQEQQALEKVVERLLKSVKEQEARVGYVYWYHPEVKKK
jgi:hypothetical protein